MKKPKPAHNEEKRLKALAEYHVLDTMEEREYDDITKIAAQICGTPIALVSLIDADRQWFKSRHGLNVSETSRELAFCAHAILEPDRLLVVENSLEDERFHDNPLATDTPHVKFYAGAPLVNEDGYALGTLCVIDHHPKSLDEGQKSALKALSQQVVSQLELRKKIRELEETKAKLESANAELNNFAYVASHDLKTPLRGIVSITQWLKTECADSMSEDGKNYVNLLQERANVLNNLINGILGYTKASAKVHELESVDLNEVVQEIEELIFPPKGFKLKIHQPLPRIEVNRAAAQQIFQNLISNAIKYNDKEAGLVEIRAEKRTDDRWEFSVEDNGSGIDPKYHERIFEMFQVLHKRDRFGYQGTGIGLSTVKKLVELHDGTITVRSRPGEGSAFVFTLPA